MMVNCFSGKLPLLLGAVWGHHCVVSDTFREFVSFEYLMQLHILHVWRFNAVLISTRRLHTVNILPLAISLGSAKRLNAVDTSVRRDFP